MAVLALAALEAADGYRGSQFEAHAKLRVMPFTFPAITAAGDIGTTIDLGILPPGRVRVYPSLSKLKASAFGAARTLEIGHTAYQKRDSAVETFEPADDNAFTATALDVSAATNDLKLDASQLSFDLYSKKGVAVQAVVKGGTIPIGATAEGYLVYSYE